MGQSEDSSAINDSIHPEAALRLARKKGQAGMSVPRARTILAHETIGELRQKFETHSYDIA